MPTLYETFLPLVQSLNDYGGNFTAMHIRRPVLDVIDAGATANAPLASVRDKLFHSMQQWTGLQDHKNFSTFFEAYYEGVFYLTALNRGLKLRHIPAGSSKGKTPDFTTEVSPPEINFEVKTIDVADPDKTYNQTMEDGLDAKIEATAQSRKSGLGITARTIFPHGTAKNRREAVEQVMRKIDSNVKAGQYEAAPTFLVVSTARTALHDRAENLRQFIPWPGQSKNASGQLFAIAAHRVNDPFFFFEEWGPSIEDLGPLGRAGILRDHQSIAGLIFLTTEWGADNSTDSVSGVYFLHGVWNSAWEENNPFDPQTAAEAKKIFEEICHAWNDTEDSRSNLLPT